MEGKFATTTEADLQKIESHLNEHAYLSGNTLGADDSLVFLSLKAAPCATKYFNTFHWYCTVNMFNKEVVKSW